jgi:hypothetical protein
MPRKPVYISVLLEKPSSPLNSSSVDGSKKSEQPTKSRTERGKRKEDTPSLTMFLYPFVFIIFIILSSIL